MPRQHWGWCWDRNYSKIHLLYIEIFIMYQFIIQMSGTADGCSGCILGWCDVGHSFSESFCVITFFFLFSSLLFFFCLRWGWHECCNHVDSGRFWEGLRKKTIAQCSETCGEYHLFFSSLPILLTHDFRAGYQNLILLWHRPNCQVSKKICVSVSQGACSILLDLIVLVINCLEACRKNTRLHPDTELTLLMFNVISCENDFIKLVLKSGWFKNKCQSQGIGIIFNFVCQIFEIKIDLENLA